MGSSLSACEGVMLFLFLSSLSLVTGSPVSPEPNVELECSIFPSCDQYGEGVWQILEDCHKYINCTRPVPGGPIVQHNMECPGHLVFANEYNECVVGQSHRMQGIPGDALPPELPQGLY